MDLLPSPLKAKAWEQRSHVWEFFSSSRGFFSSLQPLFSEAVESIFSYCAMRWAWCTVNTRAVYMKCPPRLCLSPEPDTCALAPYLDLLNHSPDVQVRHPPGDRVRFQWGHVEPATGGVSRAQGTVQLVSLPAVRSGRLLSFLLTLSPPPSILLLCFSSRLCSPGLQSLVLCPLEGLSQQLPILSDLGPKPHLLSCLFPFHTWWHGSQGLAVIAEGLAPFPRSSAA